MKTCNNCRIQVNSSREFCPLCGQTMARSTGEGYSAYPKLELPRRRFGRLKLLLIFTQVFLGITVLVDGFIRSTSYWYLVLLAGSAYTAVSGGPAKKQPRRGHPQRSVADLSPFLFRGLFQRIFPLVHQLFDPSAGHGQWGGHHCHYPAAAGLVPGLFLLSIHPPGNGRVVHAPVGNGLSHCPLDGVLRPASLPCHIDRPDVVCRRRYPGGAEKTVPFVADNIEKPPSSSRRRGRFFWNF